MTTTTMKPSPLAAPFQAYSTRMVDEIDQKISKENALHVWGDRGTGKTTFVEKAISRRVGSFEYFNCSQFSLRDVSYLLMALASTRTGLLLDEVEKLDDESMELVERVLKQAQEMGTPVVVISNTREIHRVFRLYVGETVEVKGFLDEIR